VFGGFDDFGESESLLEHFPEEDFELRRDGAVDDEVRGG
jgi:hypothetical protein